MNFFKTTFFLTIVLVLPFCVACSDESDAAPIDQMKIDLENLSGTYMDEVPYAYGEAFGQRIFTFDEGKWTLFFTLWLDNNRTQPVFQFRTVGAYQVEDKSTAVEGAYNAVFHYERKYVTLKTDNQEVIEAFGLANCGLLKDIERDITTEGCAIWRPVAVCDKDFTLLSLDSQSLLYFSERPADNDLCTVDKRPTALFLIGVKKVSDFADQKLKLEALEGTYVDVYPVARANGTFGHRRFTFQDGQWTLLFTLAFDPGLNAKIFEFRTGGAYEILRKAGNAPGAYAGIFYEDEKYLTLRTDHPEVIQGFGFTACDLELNVEKDISETGCSLWPSVEACHEDHDLAFVDHFG
ncbi:MAG: hypothetical protein AAFY41_07300, partial [Bacteroidota bacterium]